MALAHSQNANGVTHDLVDHLAAVAERAGQYASKFSASELGYWIGLWHDVGKFHPDFQTYLSSPQAKRGPDHKGAGAVLASRCLEALVFPVVGHHGGLRSLPEIKDWLREKQQSPQVLEALNIARATLASLDPPGSLPFPSWVREKLDSEFFLRMLFSTLVDADFLDTESHFHPHKSALRRGFPSLDRLWERFKADQDKLTGNKTDRVNQIRHDVYGRVATA